LDTIHDVFTVPTLTIHTFFASHVPAGGSSPTHTHHAGERGCVQVSVSVRASAGVGVGVGVGVSDSVIREREGGGQEGEGGVEGEGRDDVVPSRRQRHRASRHRPAAHCAAARRLAPIAPPPITPRPAPSRPEKKMSLELMRPLLACTSAEGMRQSGCEHGKGRGRAGARFVGESAPLYVE
jgi:hypothetical protein